MSTKYVDHLDEDEQIPGQKWVCLSFVTPQMQRIKNCKISGLKVRGVFNTHEDAKKHAQKLRMKDPNFGVFVGEVGKWLPLHPDPEQVEEEIYQEKELNSLIGNIKKNKKQENIDFQNRKEKLMKKTQVEENSKLNKVRARLRKKLAAKKLAKQKEQNSDVDSIIQQIQNEEQNIRTQKK